MSDISIGPDSIDRATGRVGGTTDINYTNPANLSGTIKLIKVYSAEAIEGLKAGIFYLVSGTTFHCRSAALLGDVPADTNKTFTTELPVQKGDYLGYYFSGTGRIEFDNLDGVGLYYISGDYVTVNSEADYTFNSAWTTSCHGEGDSIAGSLIAITPYMMF